MKKILWLAPGPYPPKPDPNKNEVFYLSEVFKGDYLSPVSVGNRENLDKINLRNFKFHYFLLSKTIISVNISKFIKFFLYVPFLMVKGFILYREKNHDLIFARDATKSGLAGLVIKKLTGAKLVIDVRGNAKKAYKYHSHGSSSKIKHMIYNRLLVYVLNSVDYIKLLYPTQLDDYPEITNRNRIVFNNFVPIRYLNEPISDEKFIFSMGWPWYLKGEDILIKAFNLISDEFPEYTLKIIGDLPNQPLFKNLAKSNKKIFLGSNMPHAEAMKIMAQCSLFVLPSRTEAMGRVLLEAMAFKKPVIGSNVDGIPYYIREGSTGLLFENENHHDLAEKLRLILSDKEFAQQLGENGHKLAHQNFSEKVYVKNFEKMVDLVLRSS